MSQAAFWLLVMTWLGQAASAPPTKAATAFEKVPVCEVARSGAAYSGRSLELTGFVAGRDPSHLLLTSGDCILGVKLEFSDEAKQHEDVRVLFAAVARNTRAGASGGPDTTISGTFEGRFSYSQDAGGGIFAVDGIDRLNFPRQKH